MGRRALLYWYLRAIFKGRYSEWLESDTLYERLAYDLDRSHSRELSLFYVPGSMKRYQQLIMIASYPQSARCTIVGQLNQAAQMLRSRRRESFINILSYLICSMLKIEWYCISKAGTSIGSSCLLATWSFSVLALFTCMKSLALFLLFILLHQFTFAQNFLDEYKKYRLERIDSLPSRKTRKSTRQILNAHIEELATIFADYKTRKNFDFNKSDTLFLVYDVPAESPFTNDIIIWSGRDTISYRHGFDMVDPSRYIKTVTFQPFTREFDIERDSLVSLVSQRDFYTITHLGDNQSILDGSYVSIYVAYKQDGQYKFESCFPKKFAKLNTSIR